MVFSHVPISLPFAFFFDHSALFIPQKKSLCLLHQPTVVPLGPIVLHHVYTEFHLSAGGVGLDDDLSRIGRALERVFTS